MRLYKVIIVVGLMVMALVDIQARQPIDVTTESQEKGRPKVAVVLSGGGAKGMAHIGVLKVIERAGIPVDIITGTSMGSIVGGLYAIGYHAELLDSLVRAQDWSYVITDREDMSRQSLSDRAKQNTYILSRGLSFGKHRESEGGFIRGKNLASLFQKLCVGYLDSLDFNSLPIPYACVATNIVDYSEHVFHSGWLPQAMRASMAIPAVFSPVRKDNMVLVDGGLRNNYPADVAREMGADVIIGVTVQSPLKTAEHLGNAMTIVGQVIDVNCQNKYEENLAMTDVPIRVNVEGYSSASFNAAAIDTLIRRGEEEAMRHWDELLALKKRIGLDDSYRPRRLSPYRPTVMTDVVKVSSFVFENMSLQDERFIRAKFRLNKVGYIDNQMEENIATSIRTDLFYQDVFMREMPDGDAYKVVFTAGKKKMSQVNVGSRFDTEDKVALQVNADFPLNTKLPMDADFTLRLGKMVLGRGELTFHPRSFTRPTFSYSFWHNDMDIYSQGKRDYNITYNQHQVSFSPINFDVRNFNIRLGVRWDYYHFQDRLSAESAREITVVNKHFLSYRAKVQYNSEVNWYFPTRGARFNAEYAYVTDNMAKLDGKAGMSAVSASWRMSFTFGERFTLQPMAYGRLLFGSVVPSILGNVIGGNWFGHYLEQHMPFAGMGHIEYVDDHFIAFQMKGQQRVGKNNYFLLRLVGAQEASQLKDIVKHSTLWGVQAGYYYYTMFGPLGASLGYSNRTEKPYFFINLGFHF